MNSMKHKILIYDDHCPLCTWYSEKFVQFGFLDKNGRVPFSTLSPEYFKKIDFEKGRNEIPLLDTKTGKVLYGIDAMLEILNSKIPFINSIGNTTGIKWFLKKMYKLISYNRKVIVAQKCGIGQIDCAPDLNYKYRILFMFLCFVFNTLMIYPIHDFILSGLSYYHLPASGLQTAHLLLVMVNCLLLFVFRKEKAVEFLGQVNMLATIVILLLSPLLVVAVFLRKLVVTAYLLAVSGFIIHEYLRRMEYAGILVLNKWIVTINFLSMTGFIFYLFN